jgi:hypothetical protein
VSADIFKEPPSRNYHQEHVEEIEKLRAELDAARDNAAMMNEAASRYLRRAEQAELYAAGMKTRRDNAIADRDALDKLRPVWAQGFSDGAIAAQTASAALAQLWEELGVNSQTDAVLKLRAALKKSPAKLD